MKLRVFIIDDEENIRDTFKWHLESLGHEVFALNDPRFCALYVGEDCDIEDTCADVLIIDYCMPKMNGIQFLELLEKHDCLSKVKFIMILTGNKNLIDSSIVGRIGCELRQKPMTIIELEEWIKKIIPQIPSGRKLADLSQFKFS